MAKRSRPGAKTILLAEDDEIVRKLTTQILHRSGYKVLVANDGEDALAVFRENADAIDLAILDVIMPRMSGRFVCEQIRALKPSLPILFCSGYSFNLLDRKFISDFGVHCIQKPFSAVDLLKMVEVALSES